MDSTELILTYSSEGYCSFLVEVGITFIGKTGRKDPKQREHYLRHALHNK